MISKFHHCHQHHCLLLLLLIYFWCDYYFILKHTYGRFHCKFVYGNGIIYNSPSKWDIDNSMIIHLCLVPCGYVTKWIQLWTVYHFENWIFINFYVLRPICSEYHWLLLFSAIKLYIAHFHKHTSDEREREKRTSNPILNSSEYNFKQFDLLLRKTLRNANIYYVYKVLFFISFFISLWVSVCYCCEDVRCSIFHFPSSTKCP